MWGSEKGTAGTGTSRRHKWAHSPSSPQSSRAHRAPTPPGPLRAPGSPAAPSSCTCLARGALPAAACPRAAGTRRSWLGRAGVGWERGPLSLHRCGRAGCGSKAPRPAGPVLLGGRSLPRRSQPGAGGHTPSLPHSSCRRCPGREGTAGPARPGGDGDGTKPSPTRACASRGFVPPPCGGSSGGTPAPHRCPRRVGEAAGVRPSSCSGRALRVPSAQ